MNGDRALFDRYRHEFESAKIPGARQRFLAALGRFHDPALQDEALRYLLEPAVRVNEMRIVVALIRSQSDQAWDRTFDWLRANYAAVTKKMPEEFQASLPAYGGGCSEPRIQIARDFFAQPAHQVQGTPKELEQTVEEVEDCVGLRAREGAAVTAYVRQLASGGDVRARPVTRH